MSIDLKTGFRFKDFEHGKIWSLYVSYSWWMHYGASTNFPSRMAVGLSVCIKCPCYVHWLEHQLPLLNVADVECWRDLLLQTLFLYRKSRLFRHVFRDGRGSIGVEQIRSCHEKLLYCYRSMCTSSEVHSLSGDRLDPWNNMLPSDSGKTSNRENSWWKQRELAYHVLKHWWVSIGYKVLMPIL